MSEKVAKTLKDDRIHRYMSKRPRRRLYSRNASREKLKNNFLLYQDGGLVVAVHSLATKIAEPLAF